MLQALINLFKRKKQERIEPVIEPVATPAVIEPVATPAVNDQITDSVTQIPAPVEKTKKPGKPRQSKKK